MTKQHYRRLCVVATALVGCSEAPEPMAPPDAAVFDTGEAGDGGTLHGDAAAGDAGLTADAQVADMSDAEPSDLGLSACSVTGTITVSGLWVDEYITQSAASSVPRDLTQIDISVFVENRGENCFAEKHVEKTVDGRITVRDLPAGPYYLYLGAPVDQYYVTDATDLVLGGPIQGRPDVVLAQDPDTRLLLDVDGLQALAPLDRVDLQSFDGAMTAFDVNATIMPAASDGDVALAGVLPYNAFFVDPPVLLGMDRLYLSQVESSSGPEGESIHRIVRFLEPAPLMMTDGSDHLISGTMQEVAVTSRGTYDWRREDMETLGAYYPPSRLISHFAGAFAAIGASRGFFGKGATLEDLSAFSGKNFRRAFELGNPFPDTSMLFSFSTWFVTDIEVPKAAPLSWPIAVSSTTFFPATEDVVIAPQLGPVENIDVEDGLSPLISWTAPQLGEAHAYYVSVREVIEGQEESTAEFRAGFWTTETSVRILPGVFVAGEAYFIRVVSQNAPNVDWKRETFHQKLPYSTTEAFVVISR